MSGNDYEAWRKALAKVGWRLPTEDAIRQMGEAFGLAAEQLRDVRFAGLVHEGMSGWEALPQDRAEWEADAEREMREAYGDPT